MVVFPDPGDIVAELRTHLRGIAKLIATTGFGAACRGLIAAGQSDPDLLRPLSDQIIEPDIEASGRRITLAQERGEVRADADVQVLRDLLYGVIEYRLVHGMPITARHIDAVHGIAFQGVR